MANTVHVAAAIIYNNDKIFVVQRAEGSMTGRWEFPGGKVEEGETAEQACRREIKEELGIDLQTMWFMDTVTYDYEDFTLSMDCFVAPLPKGQTPTLNVHICSDSKWLGRADLMSVDWLPADITLAQNLGQYWSDLFMIQDEF
ncbi:(deoxy)nucleoside triphosphate pyrophosphohydrolase [Atopobium sp. oral taxon 416]|jgi:8-oxo-dGTP diphosphatase|uniref:(deoxy)nucleoside triphosphate pyrophosphohydrolase n=1 Tax=Atopobium sp. oral taxon 416 TaxID=712157 RepID=UPI001BAB26D1|nr:(deoxy)nucleoside triphosphate pyrophosphohydrolase [Atopobium sp. oral taxon 416]QUC04810.1 (deoxy)nucleoside triphosphate pyrophosphohydrolase [Atopobium sp. oral taxon 416]